MFRPFRLMVGLLLLATSYCFAEDSLGHRRADQDAVVTGGGGGQLAGAGGGSIADFTALMNLVQAVVEPDSWEALGGVGTMAEYPQGVSVRADGLLQELETPRTDAQQNNAAKIADLLATPAPLADAPNQDWDWRQPARVRCVSLRRMSQALAMNPEGEPAAALEHLAGLSRVTMLLATPQDLVLAGPVAGFEQRDGWLIDRRTGLPPISLTGLAVGVFAARHHEPFGCTIDPDPVRLQATTALGGRINSGEVPLGLAAEQLEETLGRQNIRVFGTSPEHQVAWVMIEADRHMKRLALGDEPMPEGVRNYLAAIESTSGDAPPTDLLLRLWFRSKPLLVRSTSAADNTTILQIAGRPLELSGDNELALLSGQRGHHVIQPATQAFVDHFNQNLMSIQSKYPIYGALESVYWATAIGQALQMHGQSSDLQIVQRAILHFAARRAARLDAATMCDSIAVLHQYRKGRKRHSLLLASGGVSVRPAMTLSKDTESYPSLKAYANLAQAPSPTRWWWNANVPQR